MTPCVECVQNEVTLTNVFTAGEMRPAAIVTGKNNWLHNCLHRQNASIAA